MERESSRSVAALVRPRSRWLSWVIRSRASSWGEQLAAFARRKLSGYPAVEVINADFENWRPQRAQFDAVVAFSSFHWIAPEQRYVKTAELLAECGKLALVSTAAHVLPLDGDPFFVEVQEDYEAVVPEDPRTKADAAGPPLPEVVIELS